MAEPEGDSVQVEVPYIVRIKQISVFHVEGARISRLQNLRLQ